VRGRSAKALLKAAVLVSAAYRIATEAEADAADARFTADA
jgi:hypothetical protein